MPVFKGGSDDLENLQPLCWPCHIAKGHSSANYRVRPFAAHLDLPEMPKHGRPRGSAAPLQRISITLPPSLKDWAAAQPGGLSATVRRAMDMGMRGDFGSMAG